MEHHHHHHHDKVIIEVQVQIDEVFISRVIELINKWHDAELEIVIKQLKKTLKDLKSTPTK